MKLKFIILLTIACTCTPMEWDADDSDPRQSLLNRAAQQETLFEKLKRLATSAVSANPLQDEPESGNSSPRESVAYEDAGTIDAAILQTYAQRSSTICHQEGDKKLLVHASSSYPTAADFTCVRKNPHWRKLHSKKLKGMVLDDLHEKIRGQVEIDSFDGIQKLPCCIFTSFEISTIALSNTGDKLAIAGSQDAQFQLLIYRLKHGIGSKKIKSFDVSDLPVLIAFSPSGKLILMCCIQNSLGEMGKIYARVYSLESGNEITHLEQFDKLKRIYDMNCGWHNEDEIVAFDGLHNGYRWKVSSEPAGE